ncbi:MAG TPA: hypothetical protein VN661_07040 [Candidatus Acidoferrales bacterium]|nr:hypothetical protein [Candidatus Acidoferrales bacterium]
MKSRSTLTNRACAGYAREAVLASSLILLVLMFALTAFVTRQYHKRVHELGDQWFAKGDAELQGGGADAAIADYRNGLAFSPDNSVFQFHLAQALAASGHTGEAEGYLRSLLSASPGNGEINLTLARVAVRRSAMADALRYYHAAIYGVWEDDPIAQRWRVRRELCEYLLGRGAASQAEAEIIALANNTPKDQVAQIDTAANLLLRAQVWSRAEDEYRLALAGDRRDQDALAGAGAAAFQLGRYSEAIGFFTRLPQRGRSSGDISEMLATSRAVESGSPFLRGLSPADKAGRLRRALADSEARLSDCVQKSAGVAVPGQEPAGSDPQALLTEIRKAQGALKRASLARSLTLMDADMNLVFEAESAAARRCGPPSGAADRALVLIGREAGGDRGGASP